MIFQCFNLDDKEYRHIVQNPHFHATKRSMPEKPEEKDPKGRTLLIATLVAEVLDLTSVIFAALAFSTVKVVLYCLHHKTLKWANFCTQQ